MEFKKTILTPNLPKSDRCNGRECFADLIEKLITLPSNNPVKAHFQLKPLSIKPAVKTIAVLRLKNSTIAMDMALGFKGIKDR
jgi:hypothetical protein